MFLNNYNEAAAEMFPDPYPGVTGPDRTVSEILTISEPVAVEPVKVPEEVFMVRNLKTGKLMCDGGGFLSWPTPIIGTASEIHEEIEHFYLTSEKDEFNQGFAVVRMTDIAVVSKPEIGPMPFKTEDNTFASLFKAPTIAQA